MYERFTDRARKVMQLANQEAQRYNHEYIGTEHILLGLIKEGSGVAANVLKNLDIDLPAVRVEVERIVRAVPTDADKLLPGKLPQTPDAKKVVEYAIAEARDLAHNYVGTEHVLLGLLRQEEGVAAQVIMNLGLTLDMVREEVRELLGPSQPAPTEAEPLDFSLLETMDLPVEAQDIVNAFDQLIKQLRQMKEGPVSAADFKKAASIGYQEDKVRRLRSSFLKLWPQ